MVRVYVILSVISKRGSGEGLQVGEWASRRWGEWAMGRLLKNSFGSCKVEKYFPIYIARCVPALLRGYEWTNQERYLASAKGAMDVIARWVYNDGSLPTAVYVNQQVKRYPSMPQIVWLFMSNFQCRLDIRD